jgi:hypothetical protein
MPENQNLLMVTCENCGHSFAAEKALREQLEAKFRSEAQQAVAEDMARKHQEEMARQKASLERVAAENLADEQKRSKEAAEREQEKLKRMAGDAKRQADEAVALKKDAEAGRAAMLEAKKKEGELAQLQADIEIKQIEWKIAQAKKMAEEVRARAEELAVQRQEAAKMESDAKLKEREDQIKRMQEQIKTLSQKSEAQDNRAVGEGQELVMETMLQERFRQDTIEPVPKGERGADILQMVHVDGKNIGTICWESKKTQNFLSGFIDRLRTDMALTKSDLGVIVSGVFPAAHKDDTFFIPEDRMLVVRPYLAPLVAEMLRRRMVEVARQKDVSLMRPEKAQQVFDQVTSPGFLEALGNMASKLVELQSHNEMEYRVLAQGFVERKNMIIDMVGGLYAVADMTLGVAGASLPAAMNVMANLPKHSGSLPEPKKGKGKRGKGKMAGEMSLLASVENDEE